MVDALIKTNFNNYIVEVKKATRKVDNIFADKIVHDLILSEEKIKFDPITFIVLILSKYDMKEQIEQLNEKYRRLTNNKVIFEFYRLD